MEQLTRRTALRGAAWSVPVLAATAAVPLAAASTTESNLLAVSVSAPLEATSETYFGKPVWRTGSTYTFRAVVQNLGPDAAAPGASVEFELQTFDALATQLFTQIEVRSITPGFTPTGVQQLEHSVRFVLAEEVPAGQPIEIVFAAVAGRQEYAPRDPGDSFARISFSVVWDAAPGTDPDRGNDSAQSGYFAMANPGTPLG